MHHKLNGVRSQCAVIDSKQPHQTSLSLLCHQVVWPREGLQCPSHGPAWTQSGGPVQLLLSPFHHEDGPHASRPGS